MIRRIAPWAIGIVLTGLYIYALVGPIGNLTGLPQLGLLISTIGWVWLIVAVAVPIVIYLLCVWGTRRRSAEVRLWVLAAGLGTVALIQLEMELLVPLSTFFA